MDVGVGYRGPKTKAGGLALLNMLKSLYCNLWTKKQKNPGWLNLGPFWKKNTYLDLRLKQVLLRKKILLEKFLEKFLTAEKQQ